MKNIRYSTKYSTRYSPKYNKGFTLIELMIVVLILGVLVGVAIPSYSNYVNKAKISEARRTLMDAAARLERYYSDNNVYATGEGKIPEVAGEPIFEPMSEGGYYTITFTSSEPYQNFTLKAEPTFDEPRCRCLTYTNAGLKDVESCFTAPNNVAPSADKNACW